MKKSIHALIFGVAIIAAAVVLGKAYIQRSKKPQTISVTGLGKKDFTSDLIVWEGRFEAESITLTEAYAKLARDKKTIEAYLKTKGIRVDSIVFSAVNTNIKTKSIYSSDGNYVGDESIGYTLSQSVKIESKEVEKVEKISREVTELLNSGVKFYSDPPRYYYTQLADLKVEMISKATEDARIRAEKISEQANSELDGLVTANMGIFQITGQNSGENFSWGGTFNTSSKRKTASITMKLVYQVE